MARIKLPARCASIGFDVPDDRIGEILRPADIAPCDDPERAVRDALDSPIGSAPLEAMVRPGQTVAVIIDDVTRQTPTSNILPPVLERLHGAGVHRKDVFIAIALGSHVPMTEEEIQIKTGPTIMADYEIVNEPAWEQDRMVFLGHSGSGIPARVNRRVAEADVRIGIGCVTPHMDAGYSGGAKIILPGVCSTETVDQFHARSVNSVGNQLGNVQTGLRLDLEAFVEDRVGLDFIVNAVLTRDGSLWRCTAGHFRDAHRAAIPFADDVYAVGVSRPYPVVVANAYPNDLDLWQSNKAQGSGEIITADGGLLILATPCPRGAEVHPLFVDYLGEEPEAVEARLRAGDVEDPSAAAVAVVVGRMKRRIRMAVVSPGLTREQIETMGFLHFSTLEEAIETGLEDAAPDARVAVITHGGVTLPRLGA